MKIHRLNQMVRCDIDLQEALITIRPLVGDEFVKSCNVTSQ